MGKRQRAGVEGVAAQEGTKLSWGSLSPKTVCPQSRAKKWGFQANPVGLMSHGSRQERRKIPRLRLQDWAGGQRKLGAEGAGPTTHRRSHHGPGTAGQSGLCAALHSRPLPHPSARCLSPGQI